MAILHMVTVGERGVHEGDAISGGMSGHAVHSQWVAPYITEGGARGAVAFRVGSVVISKSRVRAQGGYPAPVPVHVIHGDGLVRRRHVDR